MADTSKACKSVKTINKKINKEMVFENSLFIIHCQWHAIFNESDYWSM